jgi:hypothetical protein
MAVRIRANVTEATGNTKHYLGTIVEGMPVPTTELPVPTWVEISEEDNAFYLLHFNAEGVCFADTWHQTLDEAKHQAEYEFRISPDEWKPA